jgi:hypothetical protein
VILPRSSDTLTSSLTHSGFCELSNPSVLAVKHSVVRSVPTFVSQCQKAGLPIASAFRHSLNGSRPVTIIYI